jgi:hypothetical protein
MDRKEAALAAAESLPATFPEGTKFFLGDWEIAVSLTPDGTCKAWDVPNGRPLAVTSLSYGRGPGVSEADFRRLLKTAD